MSTQKKSRKNQQFEKLRAVIEIITIVCKLIDWIIALLG